MHSFHVMYFHEMHNSPTKSSVQELTGPNILEFTRPDQMIDLRKVLQKWSKLNWVINF